MAKNPHVETSRKAFNNWTQAKNHAQHLLDNGEISGAEYNQIKSQADAKEKQKD